MHVLVLKSLHAALHLPAAEAFGASQKGTYRLHSKVHQIARMAGQDMKACHIRYGSSEATHLGTVDLTRSFRI